MRKIHLVLCLMLLSGCASTQTDLKLRLENSVATMAQAPIDDLADNNKPLYRYYIEPSVGRRDSTQTGNVFLLNGREFIMNLDIASVINTRFYDEILFNEQIDSAAMIAMEGSYVDYNDLEFHYMLTVYDLQDSKYFIDLSMAYVNFYAYCEYAEIEELVLMMMKIGKTVDVDAEKVIAAYSSKPSTEYVKEKLDLFETVIPDSGRIEELMGMNPQETEEEMMEDPEMDQEEDLPIEDEGNIVDEME